MAYNSKIETKRESAGWSELVEDTIGVNLRGVKTLWATIVMPVDVFNASRTLDWHGHKYSSTIRVWTFLLAIVMFMQFLWATPTSPLGEQLEVSFAAFPSSDPRLTASSTIELAIQSYVFLYPITLLLIAFVAAILTRIWGKGTTVVERIRLFFAASMPGMGIVLLTTPLVALIPDEMLLIYIISTFFAIFTADCTTAFRGLAPVYTIGARTWRSLLFGVIMQAVYQLVTSIVSGIILTVWVTQKLGIE